jgi:hypothetical protein
MKVLAGHTAGTPQSNTQTKYHELQPNRQQENPWNAAGARTSVRSNVPGANGWQREGFGI